MCSMMKVKFWFSFWETCLRNTAKQFCNSFMTFNWIKNMHWVDWITKEWKCSQLGWAPRWLTTCCSLSVALLAGCRPITLVQSKMGRTIGWVFIEFVITSMVPRWILNIWVISSPFFRSNHEILILNNVSLTIQTIVMEFGANIKGPVRTNCIQFGDAPPF